MKKHTHPPMVQLGADLATTLARLETLYDCPACNSVWRHPIARLKSRLEEHRFGVTPLPSDRRETYADYRARAAAAQRAPMTRGMWAAVNEEVDFS